MSEGDEEDLRILIVHGWMHSAARYRRLKRDLERLGICRAELYEFPGFGDTPARYKRRILAHYAVDMGQYLKEHSFDGILAHSMGGNVVLRAVLEGDREEKIMLMSPVYQGIGLRIGGLFFYPAISVGLRLLQIPCMGTGFLIRLLSLFTINRFSAVDRQIVSDVRRADAAVAARTLEEMIFDRWRVDRWRKAGSGGNSKVTLLLGRRDRVISQRHMKVLGKDLGDRLGKVEILEGIGHTAVLEDYDGLLQAVCRWIDS